MIYLKMPNEVEYWKGKIFELIDMAQKEHERYIKMGIDFYGDLSDAEKENINWYTIILNTDTEVMDYINNDWKAAQEGLMQEQEANQDFLIDLYKSKIERYIKVWVMWANHIKDNVEVIGYDTKMFCGLEKNVLLVMTVEILNNYCKQEFFLPSEEIEKEKMQNHVSYIENRNKKVLDTLKDYTMQNIKTIGDRYKADEPGYLLAHKFHIAINVLYDEYFAENTQNSINKIINDSEISAEDKNNACIQMQKNRTEKVCLAIFNLGKDFIKTKSYYEKEAYEQVYFYLTEVLKMLGRAVIDPKIGSRIHSPDLVEIQETVKTGFSNHLYFKEIVQVGLKNIADENIIVKPIVIATDFSELYKAEL